MDEARTSQLRSSVRALAAAGRPLRSADLDYSSVETISVVRTALDWQTPRATEESKVQFVVARSEVRIDDDPVRIDDDITAVEQRQRILPLQRRMISVEPTPVPVDVDEGFPIFRKAPRHLVGKPELIGLARMHESRQRAVGLPELPANYLQPAPEIGIHGVSDARPSSEQPLGKRIVIARPL